MSLNKVKNSLPNTRKQAIVTLLIVVVALGIGFAASYTLAQKSESSQQSKAADQLPAGRLPDKDGKAVYEVQLIRGTKEPVDLLLKTGDYVQFNSKDGGEHQIIQGKNTNTEHGDTAPATNDHAEAGDRPEKAKALDSGIIKPDEGYLIQFNNTGKYEFHDNYDHDYTITVIVYDPNKKAEDNKIQ